ncbi:MAG: hypothetical protein HY914_14565 [Desulfomonile tiedjei]|nr:hypothetical protein [Desulfomonile tiedjei]
MNRFYILALTVLSFACAIALGMGVAAANGIQSMTRLDEFWIGQFHKSPVMFGLWCTLLTVVWGALLGILTDQILKLIGLDLTSRETGEH